MDCSYDLTYAVELLSTREILDQEYIDMDLLLFQFTTEAEQSSCVIVRTLLSRRHIVSFT